MAFREGRSLRQDARPLYDALVNSPFASLYGSQNWAEDTADLVTFYHLTQVLAALSHQPEGPRRHLRL